ncbi:aspartate/glutamate racemase family protein [Rhodococcus sp. BP-349]|nr:aspartate/glutamate racemase family protein [Rhodococcus sp. BP-363]MBY6543171.1 aspartate/glutamate racemase family protein [Rhodococcus sp. BP-369]MBY6562401.1 aspartate/glutamate racemase family protein [Rhodococcus sp. BP-370]MBY6576693.1 aspartate/glutamate racemase family protein [Rhodococcus sp. BP-364]MBY6585994.1 aspartate/glutamate racemase family protein [Rhodococcus sp. BP-358]MBY6590331.1 aspartate/glutamate racemase family protein [Rhodococcus sp. BP-362]MBY6593136.1 aspartat
MERDLRRDLHDVADVYSARMFLTEATNAAESRMLDDHLPQAVADLATLYPQMTVFGCTSAGALRGTDYDSALCARISHITDCPTVSTIASVSLALRKATAERVAVLTPYIDEVNEKLEASLTSDGIPVAGIAGLGISDNFLLAGPTPSIIAEHALRLITEAEADHLFISCTNFRAVEALDLIRRATDVPVVTSNSAVAAAIRTRLATTTAV